MTEMPVPMPLPVRLGRGRHLGPDDGACLMELTSLLAGEQWSDHPGCVHPVLAAVARGVNDNVSDADRRRLARLASDMIGTVTDDPRTSAELVLLCTDFAARHSAAADHADICCDVASARRMARFVLSPPMLSPPGDRLLSRVLASRLLRRLYRRRAAEQAALAIAAVGAAGSGDHAVLCDLLEACVRCLTRSRLAREALARSGS